MIAGFYRQDPAARLEIIKYILTCENNGLVYHHIVKYTTGTRKPCTVHRVAGCPPMKFGFRLQRDLPSKRSQAY